MRACFAGLLVYAVVLGSAAFVLSTFRSIHPILAGVILAIVFLMAALVAFIVFNIRRPSQRKFNVIDSVAAMEAKGLLVSTDFQATRAFKVEEYEDEGQHFFIELTNKTVLYLNGQYLWDYDPDSGLSDTTPEPAFPCTRFTIRRHRTHGYVVDIQCRGNELPLEAAIDVEETPPTGDVFSGGALGDGDLITGKSYDELRNSFIKTEP